MSKLLLAVLLLAATPVAVFAQSSKGTGPSAAAPAPTANLNNPQAQSNMAGQPANAHTVPSSGDAKAIPTPVVPSHPMSAVPKQTTPAK